MTDNVNKFKRMGYDEYLNRRYKRKYFRDLKSSVGVLCNGSISDFDSESVGSIPTTPASLG